MNPQVLAMLAFLVQTPGVPCVLAPDMNVTQSATLTTVICTIPHKASDNLAAMLSTPAPAPDAQQPGDDAEPAPKPRQPETSATPDRHT